MGQRSWEWPMVDCRESHKDRVAMLRPIPFEMTRPADDPVPLSREGKALSLNISNGGMLILMEQAPAVDQVLKVFVPTPVSIAEIPTLAEVRWARPIPFGGNEVTGPYLVGLKFMF